MAKEKQEKIKTCLALPRDVWSAAKIHAIEERMQFQDVVALAIRDYISNFRALREAVERKEAR